MVHLSKVKGEKLVDRERRAKRDERVSQDPGYVYTSRYAVEQVPHHVIYEQGMPADVAKRMIQDELSLDGNPLLKYSPPIHPPTYPDVIKKRVANEDSMASFVTTYMEPQAEELMLNAMSKNFIDYEQYPQSALMQNRCINMIAGMLHAPGNRTRAVSVDAAALAEKDEAEPAVGTSTVGSSEAIMLGMLAMKKRWQNARKAAGKDWTRPNIVMSSAVQVCWEKAARYFDVEEKYVYCAEDRYVIDPAQAVDLVDENTIGICAILGTTYTGHYEDVKAINDLLVRRGVDTVIHVDAASGGFVAPFVRPELEWDFRLEKVVSINVSGHKYGLVYPGVGWAFWRSKEYLPEDLIFNVNYLGAQQATFTLNFSKGASHIIGQYYQLIRLGRAGYRAIMLNLTQIANVLAAELQKIGCFLIMNGDIGFGGVPLVAFRLKPDEERLYDEFALSAVLRRRGWVVPAYTMAPKTNEMKMMRVVVREDFTLHRCSLLVQDVKMALKALEEMDESMIQRYIQHTHEHGHRDPQGHEFYPHEKHSLHGKAGKTHGVC